MKKLILLCLLQLLITNLFSQTLARNEVSTSNISYHKPLTEIAEVSYYDWNNKSVRKADGEILKGSKIDLRNFQMPTSNTQITSMYGQRWGRQHEGLDIKVYIGDTIRAAFSGKVRIVRYNAKGWGYFVVIRHYNGLETLYGHLSKQLVKENDIVYPGQPIGLGGNSGRSTGSHLHLECRLFGKPINPQKIFDFKNQDIISDFLDINKDS